MTFDYPGYELKFIQRERCQDASAHLYTYIYKFYSPGTRHHYVIRAEYHSGDVFAIKFYCKKDRKSDFKYSRIINKGDLGNIIMTCAKVIPLLLQKYSGASFAFAASRSVDTKNKTIEDYRHTQRYKLYSYMIPLKFGYITFEHIAYDEISSYLLHNRRSAATKEQIEDVFRSTYQNLYEIHL